MRSRTCEVAAALGLSISLLGGCATPVEEPEPAPAWVGHGPDRELSQRSFVGVGSGQDPEIAAAVARAEIASVFHSEIRQVLFDYQSTRLEGGSESSAEQVEIHTQVETRMALEGAEILETWRDPSNGRYYALAALDRALLISRLRDGVERERELIRVALAMGEVSPPELQLGPVAQAREAAGRRDALLAQLRVAGGASPPAGHGEPTVASLEQRLVGLKARLPIGVEAWEVDLASGARLGSLEPLRVELAKVVTELGFPVSQVSAVPPPWLRVECSLGLAAAELPHGRWPAYRWEGSLEVSDGGLDDVLAVASEHGRVTGVDEGLARVGARRDAEASLAAELGRWLARLTLDASGSPGDAEVESSRESWTP